MDDSIANSGDTSSNKDAPVRGLGASAKPGCTSRERTDSENSEKAAMRFILPSIDGSPPKVLTFDEVSHVFKNIQNMELAHEIALNPDFKLQPYEPPENSLERRIRDVMHKAFWDVLREQLGRNPPCYDHAIQLLADIKDCFPQILSQHNSRALDHINEVLDEAVIRQQAVQGVLDFRSYANFVMQIMAKSCSPARDETIEKLTKCEDVVDTFRGILETMALMKLDMANYLLEFARNDILANSVEYEKRKFKEHLEYYKFGFPATEQWLKRNCPGSENNSITDAALSPISTDQALTNAYMELIDWNENHEFPEIISIDKERVLRLGNRAKRLCIGAALISIAGAMPIIANRSKYRITLAQQLEIILQSMNGEKDVAETLNNAWEQVKTVMNRHLRNEQQPLMDTSTETVLKTQIMQLTNKNTPVRILMAKRLEIYCRLALRTAHGLPPPPPGFGDFKEELESFTVAMKRVIAYNHSVFGDYFKQLLANPLTPADADNIETGGNAPQGDDA